MSVRTKVRLARIAAIVFVASICAVSFVGLGATIIDVRIALLMIAALGVSIIFFTYSSYLKNIAQKEEAERLNKAIRASEARFRAAFDHAAGMGLALASGQWLRVNKALCQMLGYSEEELKATNLRSITHPEDVDWMFEQITNLLRGSISSIQLEHRCMRRDGKAIWAMISVTEVVPNQSTSANLILHMQDITDRKRAEEQLVHDALHDALTGLPNRALFLDHLRKSLGRWKRRKQGWFAVLFLDLDGFKEINDTFGHLAGDQLLVEIGGRLSSSVRPGDTIARMGGDEFTILLDDLISTADAVVAVERLLQELKEPFILSGRELSVVASIGVVFSAARYDHPDDILHDADTAMYRAKKSGTGGYVIFDATAEPRHERQSQIETDLGQAVKRSELVLEYQPIVDLETGQIAGFEALLRWQHPTLGLILPANFISVAEATGAIVPIGAWVLEEACRKAREWQKSCPQYPPIYISVNLSVKQFTHPHLVEEVAVALHNAGMDPASLKLEITESMLMDAESAIRMLSHLHALGVGISIDDFGTGYSSLSYLHRLPIGTLKVDRSFVNSMVQNKESFEIVRTILNLAQSLNIKVVAEGVETEDQMERLRALKCDFGQGHFFSKPLSVEPAGIFLAANSHSSFTTQPSGAVVTYDARLVAERSQLRLAKGGAPSAIQVPTI
jgi:diguanylate cyclase (GGDEF)-like protein/PAS domain S-box-containing protein